MKRTLIVALLTLLLSAMLVAQSNNSTQSAAQSQTTSAQTQQAAQKPPTCEGPEHRQFDFWVGEWDITSVKGKKAESSVQNILAGCVIFENYRAPGYEGKSFNIYDRNTKKWHQTWVDVGGAHIEFDGGLQGDKMVLEGEQPTSKGKLINRMEYTPNADGTVRQLWTYSTDDGKTWTTAFDGIYKRKK